MPPSGPSTPSGPSNLKKVPPSGPRAQQGNAPPSGPAAQRTPIAIPFGATRYKGPYNAQHHQNNAGPSRGGYTPAGSYNRSNSQTSSLGHGQSNVFEHNSNGYSNSPSTHAESSRQALSNAPRAPASESRDPHRRQGQTTGSGSIDRSRSRSKTPPRRSQIQKAFDSYGLELSAAKTDSRTPIKIAFPTGKTTIPPKSPRLPPPPPSDRPPTPPLEAPPAPPSLARPTSPPPPPPPPPEDAAPPPPEPTPSPEKRRIPEPVLLPDPRHTPKTKLVSSTEKQRIPESLPVPDPPTTAKPKISPFSLPSITAKDAAKIAQPPTPPRPASPPLPLSPPKATSISISLPTQTAARKVVPPAFHFREIPVRRRSPSPDSVSPASEPSHLPQVEPVAPPRESTPKEPTSPPYVPEPYVAPASVFRRPGLGSFRITFDPAHDTTKKGKEVERRFDGEGLDEVKDPRLEMSVETLRRGRGPAKHRTEFQEIDYTWDSNSVGAKPLPLPCAVLLTGLNPLTTTDQVGKFLRPHGRIREMDSKMDTKSGMQLGICWVKFDTPPSSSGKTAHDIAKTVVKICDGQRIRMQGDEKIRVVLDGRGLRAQKAVKEEMERRYKPKPKPIPKAPPPPPTPTIATPASGADTPKTESNVLHKPAPAGLPSRPTPRPVPFFNNKNYASLGKAQPIRPTFQPKLPGRPGFSGFNSGGQRNDSTYASLPYSRPGRVVDLRDTWSPGRDRGRSRSRSRSRSRPRHRSRSRHSSHGSFCSTCPSDSEYSEDERYHRGRRRAATPKREKPTGPSKEDEAAVAQVQKALADNGKSHIFIDEKTLSTKDVSTSEYLRDHFRAFHPRQILSSPKGWYILFDKEGVAQNAAVLKGTIFRGSPLTFVTEIAAAAATRPNGDTSDQTLGKNSWKYLTITKKNRTAPKAVVKKPVKKRAPSFSSSSDSSTSGDDEPLRKSGTAVVSPVSKKASAIVQPTVEDVSVAAEEPMINKKRGGRPKGSKNKKAKLDPAPVVPIPASDEPPVVEINLAPAVVKPRKAVASPIDKLIADGTLVDEEDAYWLGQALAENEPDDELDLEEEAVPEDHPLYHQSGSWRAEGFKIISKTRKSEYLPQQNKAAVAEQDAAALTSGRTARVTGRRLAHDIETTRRATTTTQTSETDTFAFNQLRIRKKQLKFSRSPIEGYGLYAMESIAPGEMVCEYVGEIVRSAIAEVREQRYLKQGIGSSYLFRIDGDVVCDATFRGSVSRLINHSCDPSASAKIITINGQSKIVIYARTMLHPGQEILYDYKFPLEDDPALRVPCLCGAATCRGWLN